MNDKSYVVTVYDWLGQIEGSEICHSLEEVDEFVATFDEVADVFVDEQ